MGLLHKSRRLPALVQPPAPAPSSELTLPAAHRPYAAGGLEPGPALMNYLRWFAPPCRHYPEDLHQQYDKQRPGLLKEEQAHHDMVRGGAAAAARLRCAFA